MFVCTDNDNVLRRNCFEPLANFIVDLAHILGQLGAVKLVVIHLLQTGITYCVGISAVNAVTFLQLSAIPVPGAGRVCCDSIIGVC